MTSPELFQRKVWTWMEEKGILTKLKVQFRQQMINVLKGTDLEKEISSHKLKPRLSPKYKAINLLIAEYLLQQGYQYTLSIFTSEDPTISLIDELTALKEISYNDKKMFAFTDDDVCDILESLGFCRDNSEIHDVSKLYKEATFDSLIVCLFRCIPYGSKKEKSNDFPDGFKFFKLKIDDPTLAQTNVASSQTEPCDYFVKNEDNMDFKNHKEMQLLFDKELEIATRMEQVKYEQLINFHKSQLISELQKEKDKLKKRENKFRLKLMNEFKMEQKKLLEKERSREIQIENELHRDLEFERKKLYEEFQLRSQSENINSKTLAELQQSSLEIAMKAVQHQSNKLRKKEDLLNNKICELVKNNPNKNTKDSSCQTDINNSSTIECGCYKLNVNKNHVDKDVQTSQNICSSNERLELKSTDKHVLNKEIQTFTAEKASKESQTCVLKNITVEFSNKSNQTMKTSASSIGCQTIYTNIELSVDSTNPDKQILHDSNSAPTALEFLTDKYVQTEKLSKHDPINLTSIANDRRISSNVKNVLKELHNENVYFKAYNEQQRLHIEELTKKYALLNNDVERSQMESHNIQHSKLQASSNVDVNSNCRKPGKLFRSTNYIYELNNKEDYSSDDIGINTIKDTLYKLEREGEELEKSYSTFKKRQSEFTRSSANKYSSLINVQNDNSIIFKEDDCCKSLPCASSSKKYTYVKDFNKMSKICSLKDEPTFSCDYLDRTFIDRTDSSKFNKTRRVQEPSMNLDANIFQNYIIASRDIKQYNNKNPKLFGDMLIERNFSTHFYKPQNNLTTDASDSRSLSNQRHKLLDASKYKNVRKYYINESNSENKSHNEAALERIDNQSDKTNSSKQLSSNKYRRWSLPSAFYRKSPLSHRGRSILSEERHVDTMSKQDDVNKSKQNAAKNKLFNKDLDKKVNFIGLTKKRLIEYNKIIEPIENVPVPCNLKINDELDLDSDDIDILKSEKSKTQSDNDLSASYSLLNEENIPVSVIESKIDAENMNEIKIIVESPKCLIDSKNTLIEIINKKVPSKVDVKDSSSSNDSKIEKSITSVVPIDNIKNLDIAEIVNDPQDAGDGYLKIDGNISSMITVDDKNKTSTSSVEGSATSDDVVVPSSLELSDHSHISVPHISDDNDDFWQ